MILSKDVDFYKENGYLMVRGVFSPEEVKGMQDGINNIIQRAADAEMEQNATWKGSYLPEEERQQLVLRGYHDVQYHDASFTKAVCHPNMISILSKLIGPNVQLHHSKMLVKPPEKGAAFPMHQDYPYFPHTQHSMLAASVALDDADTENGCLRVVPKSHKQGPIDPDEHNHLEYPIEKGTPCQAKAGDVLFFNYLTIHGSDVNRSDRNRRNVLFQYRDPADLPEKNVHVNWGQGMMVCGENPQFREYKPEYGLA